MAISHAQPGEVVDLSPLADAIATTKTSTLISTASMKVIRMVLPAGKEISEHKAPGEIIVQCLEGRITFTALGKMEDLEKGQLLFLTAGEPHSVIAVEDSSFLLTILVPSTHPAK